MTPKGFLDRAYGERDVEETRRFYDEWSRVYDDELNENEYRQPARCAEALAKILANRAARIADIGCGTGLSGIALQAMGYTHLEGCDLSKGMLEKAGESGAYQALFEVNLNHPPFPRPDDHYDAITAVGVFSFGHVNADALEEFLRITKPGAPIIIGLNDKFYREGSLKQKIAQLEKENRLSLQHEEYGEHIPGIDLAGWVLTLVTCS